MNDAVTVTLIILIAVLLRRSLLTSPDGESVRVGGAEKSKTTLALVPVRADSPHTARQTKLPK